MSTLKDKVILITGAGQGLGKTIAETLAEEGAQVVLGDIQEEKVRQTAANISKKGLKAKAIHLDVSSDESIESALQKIEKELGGIDVLINNAGVDVTKSINEMSIDEFNNVLDVNLRGAAILSKKVFPVMEKRGGGHIVNVASSAAKRTWANASAYHASKWGLLGFSHAAHVEGRDKNIKVSAVVTAGMKTPFIMERFPETDPEVLQDPKNVAETINFILIGTGKSVIPEVMVMSMKETSWP